jgi:predicted PurR-regulated permease PerM
MESRIQLPEDDTPDSDNLTVNEVMGDNHDLPLLPVPSPRWNANTKLIVGLTLVAIISFLIFRFLNFIGPLLLAFILAYLFYPMAAFMNRRIGISWRITVSLLYLLLLVLLIGSITIGGFTVVEQVQNLIRFLSSAVAGLPAFFTSLTDQTISIGPFELKLEMLDLNAVSQQVLGVVQPLLTQAGTSVVSIASGAASFIGWMFFILLISYFILVESGGFRLISIKIPGYEDDTKRLGAQLVRIWDAFLRGQITIVLIAITSYIILLGMLGVKFYFGLALLAGIARFIPYIGAAVTWVSYGMVSYFQGTTILGLSPLAYSGLVVGLAWLVDVFMDNYVTPRLMSNALRVHPAAVLISALVAFNLLGVIGVVLAAPVLATLKLFLAYLVAKLPDRNPWIGMETIPPPQPLPAVVPGLQGRLNNVLKRVVNLLPKRTQ